MAERIKVGDGWTFDYHNFGAMGLVPIPIIGQDPAANWLLSGNAYNKTITVNLVNMSGDTVLVMSGTATNLPAVAATGYPIYNREKITFDISEVVDETMYVVDAGAAAAVIFGFATLRST